MERKYREIVDFLHAQEIGSYVQLPEIAVLGDTSSGKSSLLSAISGVQFPSSDQLTTRCPTRLRMEKSKDGSVSATIGIHWDPRSTYGNSNFKKIHLQGAEQWGKIGEAITQAQQHIVKSSKKDVAPDIIEVNVSSPECVDVTLIDLPGIVRAVGAGEDARIIDDIQDLLRSFLENPRCILLVVIPANVDFHNSQILQDARKVDPETSRTIPVITKPDLVDSGAEGGVLDLFLGKKTAPFMCGFHIVKCRGQKALNSGISIKQGLDNEERFFHSTKPWSTIANRNLLGIKSLGNKLAGLQIEIFKATIPVIMKEIKSQMEDSKKELDALGEDCSTPANRRKIFEKMKRDVLDQFDAALQGRVQDAWTDKDGFSLRARLLKLFDDFGDAIHQTKLANYEKPNENDLVMMTEGVEGGVGVIGELLAIKKLNDGTSVGIIHPVDERTDIFYDPPTAYLADYSKVTPKEHVEGDVYFVGGIYFNMRNKRTYKQVPLTSVVAYHGNDLRSMFEKTRCHGLPIFINSFVFDKIITELVNEEWKPLVEELQDSVASLFNEFIEWVVRTQTPKYQDRLQAWVAKVLSDRVEEVYKDCDSFLKEKVENEISAYTNNHYLFENLIKLRTEPLLQSLKRAQNSNGFVAVSTIEAYFAMNQKLGCTEHAARELQTMVSAYGKVAGKRIADSIPQTIDNRVRTKLDKHIREAMNALDSDLEDLIYESTGHQMKRRNLEDKIVRTSKAVDSFGKLFGL